MKKYSILILFLAFGLFARPVFAAASPFNFDFSGFFGFLGVHNVPKYIRVNPNITPRPTDSAHQTFGSFQRSDNPVSSEAGHGVDNHYNGNNGKGGENIKRLDDRRMISGTPEPRPTRKPQETTNRPDKFKSLVSRMTDTFQKRLDNYTKFLDKVKSRRDKLSTDGKDVTNLDNLISTASDNLTNTQSAFTTIKTALDGIDYTASTADVNKSVKDQLTSLRDTLTTLQKSMSDTVTEIVSLSGEPTKEPKPTRVMPTWDLNNRGPHNNGFNNDFGGFGNGNNGQHRGNGNGNNH